MTYTAKTVRELRTEAGTLLKKIASELKLIETELSVRMGEMYLLANSTASTIDTADAWHVLSLSEITAGSLSGWAYADGVRGDDITTYATYDSAASTLVTTTAAHNLAAGDFISITGTTNYNDIYGVLSTPSTTTFEIDKAWDTNNDATGTYARGGTLTSGGNNGGYYAAAWNCTISPQTNAHIFTMGFMINGDPCSKCRARQKLGTAGDYNTMAGHAILEISEGDKVSFIVKNVGAAGNCTIRHGNVSFTKA